MQLNPFTKITTLDPALVSIVNELLKDTSLDATEFVALVFRDPNHVAENDGHHPVEIHLNSNGDILSISSQTYEYSFEHDTFRQFDSTHDLECGRGLLGLKLANLAAQYKSGVYEVEVIRL